MVKCDPITGTCIVPDIQTEDTPAPLRSHEGLTVHYVGDPMCSWCWGVSPTISETAKFCRAEGFKFSITVGGLRAGGGDVWNPEFKTFLRKEWKQINKITGQPFGFSLLEAPYFDYDTEPACRAVVVIQLLQARGELEDFTDLAFFTAIQRKFYCHGEDPKKIEFYDDICRALNVDFGLFRELFLLPQTRDAVRQEFSRCRHWGVRSFPTLLLEYDQVIRLLAVGFVSAECVRSRIGEAVAKRYSINQR